MFFTFQRTGVTRRSGVSRHSCLLLVPILLAFLLPLFLCVHGLLVRVKVTILCRRIYRVNSGCRLRLLLRLIIVFPYLRKPWVSSLSDNTSTHASRL